MFMLPLNITLKNKQIYIADYEEEERKNEKGFWKEINKNGRKDFWAFG